MSSLQKFHRRTQSVGAAVNPFTTVGSGNTTVGYWLGTAGDGISKLIVAPKSTDTALSFGSNGITRGTTSTSDGLTNTNTLYAFGSAAHPAAYYCKSLTTGGYNTWYMPASLELQSIISNQYATPFATTNGFIFTANYQTSTEGPTVGGNNATNVYAVQTANASINADNVKGALKPVRAVRRTTI
jgi:hypothetical protein